MGLWYHFTGFGEFQSIVRDGAVLSLIERLKKNCPNQVEKIERIMEGNDGESLRRKCVFFSPQKDGSPDARGRDIRLCFDYDCEPDKDGLLKVPSLSLDYLVEVSVVSRYYDLARQVLNYEQGGKYHKTRVRIKR